MGNPGRDHHPVVGRKLVRLDDGAGPGPVQEWAHVHERDERPAGRHHPVIELVAVIVEATQHPRGRIGQVGLDEPGRVLGTCASRPVGVGRVHVAEGTGSPQLAERAAAILVTSKPAQAHAGEAAGPAQLAHRAPAGRGRSSVGT